MGQQSVGFVARPIGLDQFAVRPGPAGIVHGLLNYWVRHCWLCNAPHGMFWLLISRRWWWENYGRQKDWRAWRKIYIGWARPMIRWTGKATRWAALVLGWIWDRGMRRWAWHVNGYDWWALERKIGYWRWAG